MTTGLSFIDQSQLVCLCTVRGETIKHKIDLTLFMLTRDPDMVLPLSPFIRAECFAKKCGKNIYLEIKRTEKI